LRQPGVGPCFAQMAKEDPIFFGKRRFLHAAAPRLRPQNDSIVRFGIVQNRLLTLRIRRVAVGLRSPAEFVTQPSYTRATS
jgi:hypothetical protein